MRTLVVLLVVIAMLGGGYYWYSNSMVPDAPLPQGMPISGINTPEPVVHSGVMEDGTTDATVKEYTITNAGMTFTTKMLTAKKGDTVKITFTNTGGTHNFRIDGYDVGTKVIQAGQSETFEFVADKAGTFEYFCSVGQHRALGMKGVFTVAE